jgi:hypothetical protein
MFLLAVTDCAMVWVATKIDMDKEVLTIGGQDHRKAINQARA